MGTLLLGLITFLSAFLLFTIEFLIAKIFLPVYGGSYLVWGACVVFFQAVLLVGYWFSHHFIHRLGWARYRYLHFILLAGTLVFFPREGLLNHFVPQSWPMVLDVFWKLCCTIGPVFFVLSTISVSTQMWLTHTFLPSRANPYWLYAVSNMGSFAALLSYPFLVELYLDLPKQLMLWQWGYAGLLGINLVALVCIAYRGEHLNSKGVDDAEKAHKNQWLILGAGASMMFLSVNNIMTYELPPVPLVWIFPLGIYLLSYVFAFRQKPWIPAWITHNVAPILGCSALFYFFIQKYELTPLIEFSVLLFILFVVCMYCQTTLIQIKPQQQNQLTSFYFYISLGSFLGGILTSWIIPLMSSSMVEYLCAIVVISFYLMSHKKKPNYSPQCLRMFIYVNLFFYLWSAYFTEFRWWAVAILFALTFKSFEYLNRYRYGVVVCLVGLCVLSPIQEQLWDRKSTKQTWKLRNYYGIHQIADWNGIRWLYHGRTLHGAQFKKEAKSQQPISYYGPHSAVWDLFVRSNLPRNNVALIGLGTGSIAAFVKENQRLDIFEIDQDVYRIATEHFSFLKHSPSAKRIFIGDARLSLQELPKQNYDLLVIDAFGGDAIPVHLLTKDVFEEYRSHLSPKAAILIHVSNRYVNLVPVLANVADAVNAKIIYKKSLNQGAYYLGSTWMLVAWNDQSINEIKALPGWREYQGKRGAQRTFTDQYSSILPYLQWDYLMSFMHWGKKHP